MRMNITPIIDRLYKQDQETAKTLIKLEESGFLESVIDDRACEPSAFLWRCLKHHGNRSLSLEKEFEDFSLFPERSLAALLESEQQILHHASHLTVSQSGDNKLSFCISGQVSLDDLKQLCERIVADKHCETQ